jgi:hypothetical protein
MSAIDNYVNEFFVRILKDGEHLGLDYDTIKRIHSMWKDETDRRHAVNSIKIFFNNILEVGEYLGLEYETVKRIHSMWKDEKVNMPTTTSTTKITWRCPDCNGTHTTAASRKYYCTLLCSL